jgi:hypothetical protein
MSWYYGTYSCGHEGRTNVIGPTKNRQWIADNRFSGLCPECWEKHLQEEREKANTLAAEKAKEMELPELTGTEKQVAWANTLRQKFIDKMESVEDAKELFRKAKFSYREECCSIQKDTSKEYMKRLFSLENLEATKMYILEHYTSASYYIDNRSKDIISFLLEEREETLKTKEEKIEEIAMAEVKAEAIVKPEGCTRSGSAEITITKDKVTVIYEKDEKFRQIVKSLGYSWEGIWKRNITKFNGTAEDRAAELGNALLNAGFPITVLDTEVRQMAIDGTFVPEQTKWIKIRSKGDYKGRLVITWKGRNNTLYDTARKLPGSKWDSGVLVKADYFKEIEEFARLYDFKFSPGALEKLEETKKEYNKAKEVDPEVVEKIEDKNGLEEILNSSTDILEDLKED